MVVSSVHKCLILLVLLSVAAAKQTTATRTDQAYHDGVIEDGSFEGWEDDESTEGPEEFVDEYTEGSIEGWVGREYSDEEGEFSDEGEDVPNEEDVNAPKLPQEAMPFDNSACTATNPSPKVTRMADSPRIWAIENFFSDAECDWLIKSYTPYLGRCAGRTCEEVNGNIPVKGPLLESLNDRIFSVLFPSNTSAYGDDGLQLVRYSPGHSLGIHSDRNEPGAGDMEIVATLMVYLNEVEEGGHTKYPFSEKPQTLSVKPKKGMAVAWFSCTPDGEIDEAAVHIGKKVVKGHKWILNRFLYQNGKACQKELNVPDSIKYFL